VATRTEAGAGAFIDDHNGGGGAARRGDGDAGATSATEHAESPKRRPVLPPRRTGTRAQRRRNKAPRIPAPGPDGVIDLTIDDDDDGRSSATTHPNVVGALDSHDRGGERGGGSGAGPRTHRREGGGGGPNAAR